ncbi:hypothetical protein Syun_025206 [Stephania yunnanensis]|uniref:Helicase associated domain-containing protein n=1 Tax=Stephania yunnanensis TaxID=152371 RepID=A0AAP0HVK2_9MAGN
MTLRPIHVQEHLIHSINPVAAATATTANKFHHCFTKSDDDGFLRCEGDVGAPVYLPAVLEYLAAEERNGEGQQEDSVVPHHIQLAVRNDEELKQVARSDDDCERWSHAQHSQPLRLRKLVVVLPIDIHVNFTCGRFSTMAITKMESFGIGELLGSRFMACSSEMAISDNAFQADQNENMDIVEVDVDLLALITVNPTSEIVSDNDEFETNADHEEYDEFTSSSDSDEAFNKKSEQMSTNRKFEVGGSGIGISLHSAGSISARQHGDTLVCAPVEFVIGVAYREGVDKASLFFLVCSALGIDNISGFDWLAYLAPEAMIRALEVLYALGVLDEDAKLTSPIGFQVSEIPLCLL